MVILKKPLEVASSPENENIEHKNKGNSFKSKVIYKPSGFSGGSFGVFMGVFSKKRDRPPVA